jgi:enoyl-CoA hydratase/carnithine racemase
MALTNREFVKASAEEELALLTIDRKPVNALNPQTLREFEACLVDIESDDTLKAVIVTGAGSMSFIAGADIKEISAITSADEAREISHLGQQVFMHIEHFKKPVIAAINGVCLGGGLELAMACHLRIAGDRCRFGQPEITLGIIPGWGGTQRLPRLIGKAKALEWILTGEVYPAQEAARLGLLNQLVPQDQVLKAAKGLAKKITSKGKIPLQEALRVVTAGLAGSLQAGMEIEADAFRVVAGCSDSKEGVRAFLEKRQPKFTDH